MEYFVKVSLDRKVNLPLIRYQHFFTNVSSFFSSATLGEFSFYL